jgi:pyridoxal phosphate enzyme (YggS family)
MSYPEVVRRIAGRARLVAVTKGRALADVRALYDAGQRDFAENRADALQERRAALPLDARWHFIGNVQRNKLRLLEGCALVHSFDRLDLADRWPRALPVLLQVDFTGEPRRNGVPTPRAAEAVATLRAEGVDVRGLSTLPPRGEDPRPLFRRLRGLRDALGLRELSMGMSADYEAAVEEGATMVRVGRALFEPEA